jgi:hypothetical protein
MARYEKETEQLFACLAANGSRLRLVLRIGRLRVVACNSPGYYDRIESFRRGEPGIPAEKAFPDWNERIAAARAARA